MRILALTWKHPLDHTAGGAERYLVEVCRRWVSAGHEVTIFGPRLPAHLELPEDYLGLGLPYVGKGSRLGVFNAARRYLRANGHLYDRVLETVSTRPFAAHRIVGDKAVALYHQTAEEVWALEYPPPISLLGRYVLEPAWVRSMVTARVVAVSPSTAAALARFAVRCEAVVPPGCDAPRELTTRTGPSLAPKLLWIGRMVRAKRPQDALSAHVMIRQHFHAASLDMVGSGYLEGKLKSRQAGGVSFHGRVSEETKAALMRAADVLLLPGTREGWGIVAIEAAAFGIPAVAFDVPGLRDAVVDGVTGVVVPPSATALGQATISLLGDTCRWHRLSNSARRRAAAFSWDRAARDLLSTLRELPTSNQRLSRDPIVTAMASTPDRVHLRSSSGRSGYASHHDLHLPGSAVTCRGAVS